MDVFNSNKSDIIVNRMFHAVCHHWDVTVDQADRYLRKAKTETNVRQTNPNPSRLHTMGRTLTPNLPAILLVLARVRVVVVGD